MGEHRVQLPVIESDGAKESTESHAENGANPNGDTNDFPNHQPDTRIKNQRRHQRWLRIALYAILLLVGQSASILLGRLYYQQGGKSKWMGTLIQLVGFPILFPFYCIPASKHPTTIATTNSIIHNNRKEPSLLMLTFVYASLGLLAALNCFLYSIGLSYLPVSTYSIICSLDLAFNSLFSFFLNSQKFTPYIINSLVLLTISSILLVFETDSPSSSSSSSTQVSKKKYVIGFISTVAASAGYGLEFSLTQYAFANVLRNENFRVVLDMLVYHSLVASLATMVGLFGSGEFRGLKTEMEEYEMGKKSYVMILSFSAITWQLYTVGYLGLIQEVSSLFSNVISVVGFPIVPILAVVIFHEPMHGLKAISLVLVLWGFCSYLYQQYLDEVRKSGDSRRGE